MCGIIVGWGGVILGEHAGGTDSVWMSGCNGSTPAASSIRLRFVDFLLKRSQIVSEGSCPLLELSMKRYTVKPLHSLAA